MDRLVCSRVGPPCICLQFTRTATPPTLLVRFQWNKHTNHLIHPNCAQDQSHIHSFTGNNLWIVMDVEQDEQLIHWQSAHLLTGNITYFALLDQIKETWFYIALICWKAQLLNFRNQTYFFLRPDKQNLCISHFSLNWAASVTDLQ